MKGMVTTLRLLRQCCTTITARNSIRASRNIDRSVQLKCFTTIAQLNKIQSSPMSTTLHKVCWRCNHPAAKAAVKCQNEDCGAIQATAPDVNFYELFQIGEGASKDKPIFEIDSRKLKIAYLKLQQATHPDGFSRASKKEHAFAETQSSVINTGYNTLKDDMRRAKYILSLHGIEVTEDESAQDVDLLMEVMEMREALEEASSEQEITAIEEENKEKRRQAIESMAQAFSNEDFDQAKHFYVQSKYWESIRRSIVDRPHAHKV